jgi:hypothetical protein
MSIQASVISNRIGVHNDSIALLIAGADFVERSGGLYASPFWDKDSNDTIDKSRDEFFITGISLVPIVQLLASMPVVNNWRTVFDVTYIWQLKPLLQSLISIDSLCQSNCYMDASIIVRSLHSRVQQMTLFSLNPYLYDKWLKEPKAEIFLDGHVRRELGNHNISIFPHLYDWFSEVVHGQYLACTDLGYFEKGIFNDLSAIKNLIYTASKFLFGAVCWVGISALKLDQADNDIDLESDATFELANAIREKIMIPNRVEHFMTMHPEDRHLEKDGKNKYVIRYFDFEEYRRQLALFHRKSQPKKLNKKYC